MKEVRFSRLICFVLAGALLLSLLAPKLATAFPKTINYQGVLTDATGQPVSGSVDMTFAFYTAQSGGSSVWSETQTVQVDQGIYNVEIGATEPSGFPVSFYPSYYLGITVGTGPEMAPRQPLTAVPYAFESLRCGHADMAAAVVSGAITGNSIQDGSIADADIGGVISATKLGSHNHSGADITSGTVANARIAASIARDSEILPTVLANDGAASGLDADLLDGADSSSFASAAAVATLQSQVTALQNQVNALQTLLHHFSRVGNDITITGANLHIVDGSGDTQGATNGLGNLIVGYNELRGDATDSRTGSHNLVLGSRQSYSSFGGFLAGYENTVTQSFASICGGASNTASGQSSTVCGGTYNEASALHSSVSGGSGNKASGLDSSVSGGNGNEASGDYSAIAGGGSNLASHNRSAVAGGVGGGTSTYGMLVIAHTSYTALSSGSSEVTTTTTEHSVCALRQVSLQTGYSPNHKWCKVAQNSDSTWTLTAHSVSGEVLRCDAECF